MTLAMRGGARRSAGNERHGRTRYAEASLKAERGHGVAPAPVGSTCQAGGGRLPFHPG